MITIKESTVEKLGYPTGLDEEFGSQMRIDALRHELAAVEAKRADLIKRIKDLESEEAKGGRLEKTYKLGSMGA